MTPRRVVILGAARSGTKALRDAMAIASGAGKVPYDVGYVWRIGNEALPDDCINPGDISTRSSRFIRRFIDGYSQGQPPAVIEKTVANTMRAAAVASVLPDARFIHVVRCGVDVVESARRQWMAPADLRYLASKSKHFPLRLAPRYGSKYLASSLRRYIGRQEHFGSWGPRYPGISHDVQRESLLVVCARQWAQSVTRTHEDLVELGERVIEVRYETLVADPERELRRLAAFAGLTTTCQELLDAAATITRDHGSGRRRLAGEELQVLDVEIGDLQEALDYRRPL